MKKLVSIIVLFTFLFTSNSNAQIWKKIKKGVKRGVENTTQRRTQKDTEKATNDIYDIITGKKKKNKSDNKKEDNQNPSAVKNDNTGLEENSTLEEDDDRQVGFKRGERIIFSDNFEKDATGDFPAKWSSNQGGELKKLKGFDNKWLKVPSGSKVYIELKKQLPKNFTVEMDIIIPANVPFQMAAIGFMEEAKHNLQNTLSPEHGIAIQLYGFRDKKFYKFGNRNLHLSWAETEYTYPENKIIKLGFQINNHKRFRVYADGKKIIDLPTSFKPEFGNAIILQALTNGNKLTKQNQFYVSNVVIAESGVDERSLVSKELLEKGTFTTNDILFNSGSAKIKDSSATILKELGEAIETVPSAQFLIIGHTDSDGDDTSNKKLSLDRAESVKSYLTKNFNISANQLMCVGKGESEPISNNSTSEGKAKNRRVEFKKL